MDIVAGVTAPCTTAALFEWVGDLGRYGEWLAVVHSAQPDAGADPPAWQVELQARVGPFARSKRLRMVRAEHRPPNLAVFERHEADGRRHSPWVLRAEVSDGHGGSELRMCLHYGGRLWGPVLERVLADEISRGRARLLELVGRPEPTR